MTDPSAHAPGHDPVAGRPSSRFSRINPSSGIPEKLVYAGILVGLLLIVMGMGLLVAGKPSLLSSLMTCVGFGIVLASFGSKAGGSWAGWTATGAGAMAILLFLILQHYTPPSSTSPVKRGQIRGDLSKIADIRIIDETPLYEYRDATTVSIRFIVLDRVLRSQRMSIQVDTTEKGEGKEFFELVGSSRTIEDKYLSDSSDQTQVIQWNFDFVNRVIKDGDTIIFAEPGKLDESLVPKEAKQSALWLPLVDLAFAQETQNASRGNQSTDSIHVDVSSIFLALRSDDTAIRRNARDQLATLGPSAVEQMMTTLRAAPSDYRLRLGILYALATMLARNPDQKGAISSALKDDDFGILSAAASDNDKTIRLQAAQFLYLLGDPRVIPYSVNAAINTTDNDKAANQISILSESAQQLPTPEKDKIFQEIVKGPSPSNDVVGNAGWLRKKLDLPF